MQGSLDLVTAIPIVSALCVVFSAGSVIQRLRTNDNEIEKLKSYALESRGLIAGLSLKVELLNQAIQFDEKLDQVFKHIKKGEL
jgi:hypothetical protein